VVRQHARLVADVGDATPRRACSAPFFRLSAILRASCEVRALAPER
jgi:hypothetical protein